RSTRPEPPAVIPRTASTASSRTRVLLAQVRGSSSEDENTTFDAPVSPPTDASSSALNSSVPLGVSPAAKPDISRYVCAHNRMGALGCLLEPREVLGPLQAPPAGPAVS